MRPMNRKISILIFTIICIVFAGGCTYTTDSHTASLSPTSTPPTPESPYWIHLETKVDTFYAGENLTLSGTTNLPVGDKINITIRRSAGLVPKTQEPWEGGEWNTTVMSGYPNNTWKSQIITNPDVFFENSKYDRANCALIIYSANTSYNPEPHGIYIDIDVLNPHGNLE